MGVEARVVEQRGGAPQPGGDEHVAGGLRPARGGGAPRQAIGLGREPVLGLHVLAGEVALAVQHRLRLARRAAGEGDEARVLVAELDGRDGLGRGQLVTRDDEHVGVRRRLAEHAEVALVAHDQSRLGDREPRAQVGRPQLLGAGQHDRAEPEAREHREHPLGPVADERHHHVLAPDPAARERSRGPRRGLRDLAEAPLCARAVAPERNERPPRGRGGVDHVAGEVHPAWSVDRFVSDQTARSSNGVFPR